MHHEGTSMTNKQTNDSTFKSYGSFYDEPVDVQKHNLIRQEISSPSKKLTQLFVFSSEVYIECPLGVALILVSDSPDMADLKPFPVRHYIKLKPGIYFNLIPQTTPLTWTWAAPHVQPQTVPLPSPYTYQSVSVPLHVRRILDCWFTKHSKSCQIIKPAHRSYELLYTYEGSMHVELSSGRYSLQPHDLIIYRSDRAVLDISENCSYLTAVFELNQRKALHILNNTFHCTSELQQILWKLLIESGENSYYTKTLMECYLQEAILLLMQFYESISHKALFADNNSARNDLLSEILSYMNKRITEPVTIEDICHEFYISRSSLQALFKTHLNTSPKNYLLNIKLQKSKELIRQNQYTISETAYMLGFSSIHYFSRLFKKYFNTTPSAYAKKIAENQNKQQNGHQV